MVLSAKHQQRGRCSTPVFRIVTAHTQQQAKGNKMIIDTVTAAGVCGFMLGLSGGVLCAVIAFGYHRPPERKPEFGKYEPTEFLKSLLEKSPEYRFLNSQTQIDGWARHLLVATRKTNDGRTEFVNIRTNGAQ